MLFLLPLLLLPSCSSLSCLPTLSCLPKDVPPSSCPSGEVVSGPCGCPECALTKWEVCGGPWNIAGICAAGLICLDTEGKEIRFPESQIEGVCRPSCQEGSTLGWDYTGTKASTAEGRTCQAWDSSSPHGCDGEPCFPELKDNHCRNPDNETGGVWCYTTDSGKRWEYCDVPKCSEEPPCPQVLCCGSDGTTYPTPCAAPPGVTCVSNKECPPKACPHTDSDWTSWSTCSPPTSCRSSRTRAIVAGCGKDCRKEKVTEERRCPSCCPLVSSPWSPWSPCPVACGGGVIRKTRAIVLDREGECYRQMIEQEDACNIERCPAPGVGGGGVCAQVICCGSDGITYPTPCDTPDGVTCVDYNECPAKPDEGCPRCPVGSASLTPEQSAVVDWAVARLEGSTDSCPRTRLEVTNFTSQVVAGTMYEFDLVVGHSAASTVAACGAEAAAEESCHLVVWEKVWEDFREVQWDHSSCSRSPEPCGSPACGLVCGPMEECSPTGAVCVRAPCCPAHTCCPKGCPKIYAPVCGTNGETYSNDCELKRASCSSSTDIAIDYKGECTEDECPKMCPEIYNPVCGSNGKSYGNKCFLQMASCTTPITLDYEGKCEKSGCDGGDSCCTPSSPCAAGEGDCDSDSECLAGLACGEDNCSGGTFEDDDDCCEVRPLQEQTIAWEKGMSPAELCVTPGTNVTFSWTSGHNLVEVDEASYTSCAGLSPTSPATGPVTWSAPRDNGTHYFACGVSGHCSKGMKAKVEVAKVCLPGVWLAPHNEKRQLHQDTPDLVADQALITKAQGCADGLASSGVLKHCSSGENLYVSSGSGGDLYQAVVDAWYAEGQVWRYNEGMGFSMATGHFTQVVWVGTTRIGCATARGNQRTYVVCNYGPPGNMQGAYDNNVLALN